MVNEVGFYNAFKCNCTNARVKTHQLRWLKVGQELH